MSYKRSVLVLSGVLLTSGLAFAEGLAPLGEGATRFGPIEVTDDTQWREIEVTVSKAAIERQARIKEMTIEQRHVLATLRQRLDAAIDSAEAAEIEREIAQLPERKQALIQEIRAEVAQIPDAGEMQTIRIKAPIVSPEVGFLEETSPSLDRQTAASPTATTYYDSLPGLNTGQGLVADTNGVFGLPQAVGDDYELMFDGFDNPIQLDTFSFYGQVAEDQTTNPGTAFFWFYNPNWNFVGGMAIGFGSSAQTQHNIGPIGWYMPIPWAGFIVMETADGSNGTNSAGLWNGSSGVSVGANDSSNAIENWVVGNTLINPDILAFKLTGDSMYVPLQHAGNSNCCGERPGQAGCGNATCEAIVGAMESWCTSTEWYDYCGLLAQLFCDPGLCKLKNRYISFKVHPSVWGTNRVIFLYPDLLYDTGRGCEPRPAGWPSLTSNVYGIDGGDRWARWVDGPPEDSLGGFFYGSSIGVGQGFAIPDDWLGPSLGNEVHLWGPEILPCSYYELWITDDVNYRGCTGNYYSCVWAGPFYVATSQFGNVNPWDALLVLDVAEVVDKLKLTAGRMSKVYTQLQPSLVDPWTPDISVLDVATAVDGVKSKPFPCHGVPDSVDTCGP